MFNTTTDESDVACAPRRRARQVSLSLSRFSLPRSIALALTNLCWLCVCVCVCGEKESCVPFPASISKEAQISTQFSGFALLHSRQRRSLSASSARVNSPFQLQCLPLFLCPALPWLTVLCSLALVQSLTVAAPTRVVLFTSSPAPVATFATEIFQTLATRQACGER